MNTSQLKKFAQGARQKLIQQVGAKLEYVLSHDTAELREKASQIKAMKEEINRIGKTQLIEKVAYTWFNRLMALRFMDANDYQPSGIRIVSPKDGFTSPQILEEAKQGVLVDGGGAVNGGLVNIGWEPVVGQVNDLLDGRLPSSNPQNEAYRLLLIRTCNALHKQFPFLFERIEDYSELLLPDDLTSSFSIVHDMVEGMTTEDCQHVEAIGWLYQFYISEKKDEVFASKAKVKKEDIPAATQLFTPRWIVEYMVQNTLGKLWLQNNPRSGLREHMPYFIESASSESDDYLKVDSVEEIKFLDQACGSGHILVYAFELFAKIYEEEGYNPSDIPGLIIEKNLHGFEIDERAAQLAGFSLLMKARGYYRRLFRKKITSNILCFEDVHFEPNELENYLDKMNLDLFNQDLIADIKLFEQATNLGSLIQPRTQNIPIIEENLPPSDIFLASTQSKVISVFRQIECLNQKFHCVVDNPPYMGGGNMNRALSDFVKAKYPESKADLMAAFMECGLNALLPKGFLGMINQHSWMFLSSYEKLREKMIDNVFFDTLLHLGPRTFPEIGGEVVQNTSFTIVNAELEARGSYLRLVEYGNSELKRTKTLEAIQNPECGWLFMADQKDFKQILASPIGYWLSVTQINIFSENLTIGEDGEPKVGIQTGDNERFLREWYEIDNNKIGIVWKEYDKGGETRKWFGNKSLVVQWRDNGRLIKKHPKSVLRNQRYYFKESIQWSRISSGRIGARYTEGNSLFDINSASLFLKSNEKLLNTLGYLNSNSCLSFLAVLAPTLTFQVGDIARVPIKEEFQSTNLVKQCIQISEEEWDSKEISWNHGINGILKNKEQDLRESYDLYCHYWTNKFHQLHKNEAELNCHFIEIYGLQDELTPKVPFEDITILKQETSIEEGKLVFHADKVMAQFVSYAVGCMFGRYSLDQEGLILTNQGETLADYFDKIGTSTPLSNQFLPDDDAIIPVLEDEWFKDDIVGRFYEFLKVAYDEKGYRENLAFVEQSLGMDIRKYFVRDFYNDHIKRYKKRPIYWMFSSPKGHFNALVYLHRYTPDTINNILNNYLRVFIQKLKSQKAHYEHLQISGTPAEQNRATKQIDKLDKMLLDCEEYEREILYPLATERIAIDLDDGVLVNYNYFGRAVKEVKGLNDSKAKKKVRGFDWIDGSGIRD